MGENVRGKVVSVVEVTPSVTSSPEIRNIMTNIDFHLPCSQFNRDATRSAQHKCRASIIGYH